MHFINIKKCPINKNIRINPIKLNEKFILAGIDFKGKNLTSTNI